MPRPPEYENLIKTRAFALSTGEFAAVTKAHERRNNTSYVSPFPPVSQAEAAVMVGILEKYLPVARAYTAQSNGEVKFPD